MKLIVFKAERFVYCDVYICYGTAVEHKSLLNPSGVFDGIICCNIFFVHTAVFN